MKSLVLFTLLVVGTTIFAQQSTQLFGDIQVGAGMTVKGNKLYHGSAGFNVIFENQLYLRAGASFALGGRFTNPNATVGYTCYDLRLGYSNDITESFRVVPYLGLGYHSVLTTTRTPEPIVDDLNQVTGLVDIEIEQRYETMNDQTFCAPIGVDFHINNGKVGTVIGFYYLISRYAETGIRIGFTFGRQ